MMMGIRAVVRACFRRRSSCESLQGPRSQRQVYGLAVEEAPVETLRRMIAAGAFYNIISQS